MLEELFYSPHLAPISVPEGYEDGGVEACDLRKECFKLKTLADAQPITKSKDKYTSEMQNLMAQLKIFEVESIIEEAMLGEDNVGILLSPSHRLIRQVPIGRAILC